jgi:hypothetical protein
MVRRMGLMELVAFGILVVAAATLITIHVALAWGLARRGPVLRGVIALLVPPLAPYWGYEADLKKRCAAWVVSLVVYVIALTVNLL